MQGCHHGILATAAIAVAALAPGATPPPAPDPTIEPAVLETFVAELDAARVPYLAPACTFWVAASDNPDVSIWRCYATLGTADDFAVDVATSVVTHDAATGETMALETLAYAESGCCRSTAPRLGSRPSSAPEVTLLRCRLANFDLKK